MTAAPRREEYLITERAGPRVAGQLVAGRKTIELTPEEAAYELREGTIEKAPAKAGKTPSNGPSKAD